MSMFPHTVTVYNTETGETPENNFQPGLVNHITVLHGVLLDASKGANVRSSGLVGADAVNLYIPMNVRAVDGVTGREKRFVDHVAFWRASDKSDIWTLNVGENTFFVKGEVVEPDKSVSFIEMAYADVYSVTKIDVKDFGGLQHIQVGGA